MRNDNTHSCPISSPGWFYIHTFWLDRNKTENREALTRCDREVDYEPNYSLFRLAQYDFGSSQCCQGSRRNIFKILKSFPTLIKISRLLNLLSKLLNIPRHRPNEKCQEDSTKCPDFFVFFFFLLRFMCPRSSRFSGKFSLHLTALDRAEKCVCRIGLEFRRLQARVPNKSKFEDRKYKSNSWKLTLVVIIIGSRWQHYLQFRNYRITLFASFSLQILSNR